jgi:hypothetical protein
LFIPVIYNIVLFLGWDSGSLWDDVPSGRTKGLLPEVRIGGRGTGPAREGQAWWRPSLVAYQVASPSIP